MPDPQSSSATPAPSASNVLHGTDDIFDILKRRWLTVTVLLVLAVVGIQWFRHSFYDQGYAPEQPIPFSHKIHAGDLHMDCKYCHFNAERGKHAGVPHMATCLGCHATDKGGVVADRPNIKKLLEIADKGSYTDTATGIVHEGGVVHWKRVHKLPDFVYFPHQWHVAAGVACQTCHGPVETMPVVRQHATLTMGWCIDCHRNTNYVGGPNHRSEDPASFTVGTSNYAVQIGPGRVNPDETAIFEPRKTKGNPELAGKTGHGDHAAPASHDGHGAAPAKAKNEILAPVPDGPFSVHGAISKDQNQRLQDLFAQHPAWKERLKSLPRWRVADLPETHRAYYYDSEESLKKLVAKWSGSAEPTDEQIRAFIVKNNFVNSPTQCSTCHQ